MSRRTYREQNRNFSLPSRVLLNFAALEIQFYNFRDRRSAKLRFSYDSRVHRFDRYTRFGGAAHYMRLYLSYAVQFADAITTTQIYLSLCVVWNKRENVFKIYECITKNVYALVDREM